MENNVIKLPMVALRGLTVLPDMIVHFDVTRVQSIEAIQAALKGENQKIFLVTQRDLKTDRPKQEDVFEIGITASVKHMVKTPKNIHRVMVCGESRARLLTMSSEQAGAFAEIEVLPQEEVEAVENHPIAKSIRELFGEFTALSGKVNKESALRVAGITKLSQLIAEIGVAIPLDYVSMQQLLESDSQKERAQILAWKLAEVIEVLKLRNDIQNKVKEHMDKHQREFLLREQMKVIREELGEDNVQSEAEEFQERLDKLQASDEVKEKIQKEISRFKSSLNSPAESGVIRTYIETMLEMPWDKTCEEYNDLAYARKLLEEEHYGLEKVKERILEFMAVRTLTKKGDSPILCLVGPPGTGKTSIAKSLAKAMKKPYTRISLGGVRDEAEIRGHRKTYVGAMPGRIANALRSTGVKNPLILLDEIDKVSNDYKGDTFSALLEVLDGEQNVRFRDHYLEVPVDLSEVLFVTTANTLQTIPKPLLDRMEVIEISSYTENEKFHIATKHLIPKELAKHGLTDKQLKISKGVVWKIARNYTKEAGVRQLERKIGDICRKTAKEILETGKEQVHVKSANLEKFLGKEKYSYQKINDSDEVGIVRGLAWTSVGGDTLQIEVNIMPGKGEVLLTGQLGDIMKESARTGISYIRSVGPEFQIAEDFFEKKDIHIHIPEGAVPKDGPSAGITMATAMISAVTGVKVRADVAMTGEITLRGRVLPIGGLKEKLLAAKTAGIKTVLVPDKNRPDVAEIAEEIKEGMEIVFVSHMSEVLEKALVKEE